MQGDEQAGRGRARSEEGLEAVVLMGNWYTVIPSIGDADLSFVKKPDGELMLDKFGLPEVMSTDSAQRFADACNSTEPVQRRNRS